MYKFTYKDCSGNVPKVILICQASSVSEADSTLLKQVGIDIAQNKYKTFSYITVMVERI